MISFKQISLITYYYLRIFSEDSILLITAAVQGLGRVAVVAWLNFRSLSRFNRYCSHYKLYSYCSVYNIMDGITIYF